MRSYNGDVAAGQLAVFQGATDSFSETVLAIWEFKASRVHLIWDATLIISIESQAECYHPKQSLPGRRLPAF
jgi:hypothetical protein